MTALDVRVQDFDKPQTARGTVSQNPPLLVYFMTEANAQNVFS